MINDDKHIFLCLRFVYLTLWSVCSNIFSLENWLFILLRLRHCLYIPDTNPLSHTHTYCISLCVLPSHFCNRNFYLWKSRRFYFWWCPVHLFFLMWLMFFSEKSLPLLGSEKFPPTFSSRTFMLLAFAFKPMAQMKLLLLFLFDVSEGLRFIVFCRDIPMFQQHLLKPLFLPHWILSTLMSKVIIDPCACRPVFSCSAQFHWFLCLSLYSFHMLSVAAAL